MTDQEAMSVAGAGKQWLITPITAPCRHAMPYHPSSDYADAWLIGAWVAYHEGDALRNLHKSRGHSWIVHTISGEKRVKITSPYDHKEGVSVC